MPLVTIGSIKNKQEGIDNNKKILTNKQGRKTNYQDILHQQPANRRQTGDKLETNRRQTGDKPEINRRQTGDKLETNRRQTGDKLETNFEEIKETVDKLETEPETQTETNRRQTVDKLETNHTFSSLVGNQRKIIIFIYNQCRQAASFISPPITLEHISQSCQIPINSMKKTIHRLNKKGILVRASFKSGRGGWTKYKLIQPIYSELLNLETVDKLETNCRQTVDKLETEPETEPETRPPSSSSSNLLIKKLIKKNTTTTTPLDEGLGIDIPDNLKEIGFGASQISHVFNNAKNPLTPQELQDSLDAFSYDLKQELIKPKTSPLNFLMGVLLKRGAYTSEAILIESKKEIESYMKTIKELEISMEDLKSVNKQKQFEKWLETIPDDERNKIVPPSPLIKTGSRYQLVMLKDYWEKEINSNNS